METVAVRIGGRVLLISALLHYVIHSLPHLPVCHFLVLFLLHKQISEEAMYTSLPLLGEEDAMDERKNSLSSLIISQIYTHRSKIDRRLWTKTRQESWPGFAAGRMFAFL